MDLKFKNGQGIIWAVFFSAIQIALFKELFQMFIVAIFGGGNSEFSFIFPSFQYYFEPLPDRLMPELLLLYFAPYIYLVLSVEVATATMRKIPHGKGRFFLVIFILIQIGYLLIHIFYSAVILILSPNIQNDWIALTLYLGYDEIERFIFTFAVIFLFVFYLNISTKRIQKYINY